MTIEKLTDQDRIHLWDITGQHPANDRADSVGKALRIIDQLTEALAAARVRVRELEAEVERLREKLGLTERTALTAIRTADREGDRAESELAQLRERVAMATEILSEDAGPGSSKLAGMIGRAREALRGK